MSKKVVYCISGLGADERVFKNLELKAEIKHVRWVKPLADENISSYAKRLAEQIDASQPFLLLGVSFGGILAQELNRYVAPEKTIIVSSVSSPNQLPLFYRLRLLIPLLVFVPDSLLAPPNRLSAFLFGIQQKADRKLFYQILKSADPAFTRWAIRSVIKLQEIYRVNSLLHLHGTGDKVIPCPKSYEVIKLKGAGHFMIYNRAKEISAAINGHL